MLVEMKEVEPRIEQHEHFSVDCQYSSNYDKIVLKNFKGYWTLTINYLDGLIKQYKSADQHKVLAAFEREEEIQLEIPY